MCVKLLMNIKMSTTNLINLIGLQRFGCHAVGNWLLHQYPSIQHSYELETYPNEIEEQNDVSGFIHNDLSFLLYNQFWFKYQETFSPTKLGYTPQRSVGNAVIVYEVGEIRHFNVNFDNKSILGKIENELNIIVLRDLLNGCASWYKKHDEVPPHIVLFWYHRILEIIGRTNYVPNCYFINYNKWFIDRIYRKQICKDLHLEFTDVAIDTVADFGIGSSFTQRSFNGKAQEMKVNERWMEYTEDQRFVDTMRQYQDLIKTSEAMFGKYNENSIIFSST